MKQFNPFNDLTSIDCALTNPRASIISTISSLTWRNGRRVRLRTVWGNPWRFDSSREHHHSALCVPLQDICVLFLREIWKVTAPFSEAELGIFFGHLDTQNDSNILRT